MQSRKLYPREWPKKMEATSIDLNKDIETDFESGIAYASTVALTIPVSFDTVREALKKDPHAVMDLISKVKTLRNFETVKESQSDDDLKLSVNVPVLADFKTHVRVRVYEVGQEKGVLDARQIGDYGDLAYNRCYVILEPDKDSTRAFVLGVHILKPEKKISWAGRAIATNFAKTHYSNYLYALMEMLNIKH